MFHTFYTLFFKTASFFSPKISFDVVLFFVLCFYNYTARDCLFFFFTSYQQMTHAYARHKTEVVYTESCL